MKLIRILSIFTFLFLIIFLNWNCSDDGITNKSSDQTIQTDGGTESVSLWVHEYCLVTPPFPDAPYYAYLQVRLSSFTGLPPYGYTNDSFTTPDSSRYINGTHYETQHFRITKLANWKCETNNCAARYYIQNILSEDHMFNHGTCTNGCSGSMYSCDSYSDEDIVELPQNTTYNTRVGADCIVDDAWQNE